MFNLDCYILYTDNTVFLRKWFIKGFQILKENKKQVPVKNDNQYLIKIQIKEPHLLYIFNHCISKISSIHLTENNFYGV